MHCALRHLQLAISDTLISSGHGIKNPDFLKEMQVNREDSPPDNYVT